MADEERLRKIREFIERAAREHQDDSDTPDLSDSYTAAPEPLTEPIAAAGGDPRQVVEWFECGNGKVYRFKLHGRDATRGWKTLRKQAVPLGYWPVILGPNISIKSQESLTAGQAPDYVERTLGLAETLRADKRKASGFRRLLTAGRKRRRRKALDWPDEETLEIPTEFSAPLDALSGKPMKQVWLGLLPVRKSWEAAAVMQFGDWNAVPPPEIQVVLHRRWHEEFGAELVTMMHDTIEFQVKRHPTTREDALRLAELHYDYCEDIVEQGTGSIEVLAAMLLKAKIWYFWWD